MHFMPKIAMPVAIGDLTGQHLFGIGNAYHQTDNHRFDTLNSINATANSLSAKPERCGDIFATVNWAVLPVKSVYQGHCVQGGIVDLVGK